MPTRRVEAWQVGGSPQALRRRGRPDLLLDGFTPLVTKPTVATNLTPLLVLRDAGALVNVINGDYVHSSTAAETVLENFIVTGQVRTTSTAGHLTLRTGLIYVGAMPAPGGTVFKSGVQGSFNNVAGITCERVAVIPSQRTVDTYGFHVRHLEAYRCYVEGAVDAFVAYASAGRTAVVEDCYGVAGPYYPSDPRQTDGSHNDFTQFDGAGSGRLRNNNADGFNNAFIQVTQNQGRIEGMVVDGNYAGGGRLATMNFSDKGKGFIGNVAGLKVRGNRFYRETHGRAALIETTTRSSPLYEWSGNVWDDDGAAIAAANNGGAGT